MNLFAIQYTGGHPKTEMFFAGRENEPRSQNYYLYCSGVAETCLKNMVWPENWTLTGISPERAKKDGIIL